MKFWISGLQIALLGLPPNFSFREIGTNVTGFGSGDLEYKKDNCHLVAHFHRH